MKRNEPELIWDGECVVCRKSVDKGQEFCHVNIEGEMIALCCPLCSETFKKDPKQYMRRRAVRKLSAGVPPGSFSRFDL